MHKQTLGCGVSKCVNQKAERFFHFLYAFVIVYTKLNLGTHPLDFKESNVKILQQMSSVYVLRV